MKTLFLIEANKHKHKHAFIDFCNIGIPINEMIRFYTGEYIAETWNVKLKTVVLTTKKIYNQFAETVAINRGAYIKVFLNKDEAIKWHLN